MEVRDLVPPLLIKMGRRIRDRISDNGRQSFSTYDAALQACR